MGRADRPRAFRPRSFPFAGRFLLAAGLSLGATSCIDLSEPNAAPAETSIPVAIPTPFAGTTPIGTTADIDAVGELVSALADAEQADRNAFDDEQQAAAESAVDRLERTAGTELNDLSQAEFAARVEMQAGGDEANAAAIAWLNYGQQISELKEILTEDFYREAISTYAGREARRSELYSGVVAEAIFDGEQTPAQRDQVASQLLAVCSTKVRGFEPFEARRYLREQLLEDQRDVTLSFSALTAVCPRYQDQVAAVLAEASAAAAESEDDEDDEAAAGDTDDGG